MSSAAVIILRPLALSAALILPLAASAFAQQAGTGATQPQQSPAATQSAQVGPGTQFPSGPQFQPGPPPGPMYQGGPAWPGAMQRPMYPGMHPGMQYQGQPGATDMSQQQAQQGPQGGPGMQPPMMHPGMMHHGPYGQPMQPPQADGGPDDAVPQPPQGPMMGGPMMGAPMNGPMYGPGMHHGPGPMGGPMMGGPMMAGPMMGGMCPMGAPDFADGRLAFLKAELGITDKQKAAFDAFAKVVKSHGEGRGDRREAMMKSFSEAKTPLDRLSARISMMEMRTTMMKEMKGALDSLYGTLTDEQKQKADFLLPGMGGMRCMM